MMRIAILATMAKRILKKRLIAFVLMDYFLYSFSDSVTLLMRRLGNLFAPISDTQALEYLVDKNRHGNLAWVYYHLIDNKLRLANSLSASYLLKFSRFVCQDTSTNCLQLLGFLPEQSAANIQRK